MINDAAELRLLAAVIDNPDLVLKVSPELFTQERQAIFTSMKRAYSTYREISYEGVELFYGKPLPPELESARGALAEPIIDQLRVLATKRQLVDVSNKITRLIQHPNPSRDEILKLLQLPSVAVQEDTTIVPGITAFTYDLQRKRSGQYEFVRTGMRFLDHMLCGEWPRQALTVVLGKAGGGKTALVCNSMVNMARLGIPSLFISLEMPRARLMSRLVANIAEVDGMRIKTGDISEEELARVDVAIQELQSLPIYIYDDQAATISDILYQIKLHKDQHDIKVFFLDYLQIINRNASDDETNALGSLTQSLRSSAIDLDIAAVMLSQQNRAHTGLSSILGSGRVGHIADVVFEIELQDSNTDGDRKGCTFNFHKNRDGKIGSCLCVYQPQYLRFE